MHWIDSKYKRRSAALAYRRFKGAHTFDRIKDLLLETYSDFDIDPTKIVCSVTDNGSIFVKAFKIFGVNTTCLIEYDENNECSSPSSSENELSGEELEVSEGEFGTRQEHGGDDLLLEENIVYGHSQNSLLPFHFRCNARA